MKAQEEYRVLARKYRPQNFDELIGQDALVQTLRNAIDSGRIAHAFMLTGVRGVGKTTTARIIAKALNYKGPDGTSGPTSGNTSDCALCEAISQDRHPDVIEMDAASRTGVDDIREILDGIRYAPSEARYKIYIIDEIHMLSKGAFNALLKTLEEPPSHVKFIFATTEIRKVPITVLSRCQRFDLKRVDVPTLVAHFSGICDKESVTTEEEALRLIARAADGSVRDGLSILDRAITLGEGKVETTLLQEMLGLSDQGRMLDILEHCLGGALDKALPILDDLYAAGCDPDLVMQDMLEFTHLLTRQHALKEEMNSAEHALSPDLLERLADMAPKLSMPSLSKAWQILIKGTQEVQQAPHPQAAAEMVIIRLAYAANLPDPRQLLEKLKDSQDEGLANNSQSSSSKTMQSSPSASMARPTMTAAAPITSSPTPPTSSDTVNASAGAGTPVMASIAPSVMPAVQISSLADLVQMLECANEVVLASEVFHHAEPIRVEPGLVELGLRNGSSGKIKLLQKTLNALSQQKWVVVFANPTGTPTLAEQEAERKQAEYQNVLAMPVIQDIITSFPGAKLSEIIKKDTH